MISLVEKRGIIIAIIIAIAAAVSSILWLKNVQRNLERAAAQQLLETQANTTDAIYAKVDIPSDKVITEDMLFTRLVYKDKLPPGAATSIARVVGRVATSQLKKDSMISVDKLAWPTTKETSLAMRTPVGRRAMTIPVDNISSLMGMIRPGDYVDVIGLIALPVQIEGKQAAQPATVPLFQNVLVLAVGSQIGTIAEKESASQRRTQEAAPPKESAPLITLALTPEEANLLSFVQEQGKIRLVLRSPGDAKTQPVQLASWDTLLKYLFPNIDFMQKEEKKEAKEVPTVEVIRGFKREMMPIQN